MLQGLRTVDEEASHLFGIGLVAGDILLRELEDPVDLLLDLGRNLDGLLEGAQFGRSHNAVRDGHLGRQRDDCEGEGRVTAAR